MGISPSRIGRKPARVKRLLALHGPLAFIIDLFLTNVKCSDVHYFFAYYRGEFRQCLRQFFSQWFTCLFELKGISPNHTLLLNPWYDLNYQRRIVRWSSLVEFTETLIGMQWVHGSYSKTVEGSDFRWPLSSISMHSIKSRPRRGFFPPHHITSTFFKSNGRLDSKMSMDHHWRKIGVFLSEF